jgi:signal transduction histidine kinase
MAESTEMSTISGTEPNDTGMRRRVSDTHRRDRLRGIIERLPDGIVVVDGVGNIRFANPAAVRLFGRSSQELIGTPFGFPLIIGETTEIDIVQRAGADICYAELRVVDAEWEDEQMKLVALRDVTDRKRAEERAHQLTREREARLEAEAASQAKSEFLAIMSHELRTPLNAVLGYAELLELGISGPLTDGQREQLRRIGMSGRHLLGLVNEVLDLAKVEAGRLSVRSAPATAEEAVVSAIALIQPQAAARGLQLVVSPLPDPGPVYIGDDERVRQILVNLLSNAVKFTPPGGKVGVDVSTTDKPDRTARLLGNRPYVCMGVKDSGVGIPENKLISIFDPFVQAESGHTRSTEGSGLGLTISRRLARLMGGDLTVKSAAGQGSEFILWLPAEPSATNVVEKKMLAPTTTSVSPGVTADHNTEGLSDVGETLLRELDKTLETIVARIRSDESLSITAGLKFSQLADHIGTFLADVAGALVIIEESGGQSSALLADATEIQRLVSERHGTQRARLGWTESALRREFMIIREELERVVQRGFRHGRKLQVEDAVAVLERFVDQAEFVTVRALEAVRSG